MIDISNIQTYNELALDSIPLKEAEELNKNCYTGDSDYLVDGLKSGFKKAKRIDLIVAFLMESGVREIEKELKEAVDRNVNIRILTGNYLNITQPQALYLIKDLLGDKVDLRFYKNKNRSFHPKAYFFEYESDAELFIGSSNISRSALTSGIEWNYKINRNKNIKDYKVFYDVFENLFNNQSIIINDNELDIYSKTYKKPKFVGFSDYIEDHKKDIHNKPYPREAQIEALYKLKQTRKQGADKGLVVAATGVGKTYLGAFDTIGFKKILFIAHREEILSQAKDTFTRVRPENKAGVFANIIKDKNVDMLFASVQTLGQKKYLTSDYFKKDDFDYIIIDEFHHSVAKNYQNIINYFNPKFLLGLTATPIRMDNRDVFEVCDNNLVYDAGLKISINRGWLVPFRYYGIYDETDYQEITYKYGKYDEVELEKMLMLNKRADLILKHYNKFNSKRCLGFCCSRNHAKYMAKYFNSAGIKSCYVISGDGDEYRIERKEAIRKLLKGEINVIFSVDMFNEGLDIPSIDLELFLRPTESPTIFLQQLGRGLRKFEKKKYLNIIDFIGNYKKASLIPFLLTGDAMNFGSRSNIGVIPKEENYPEDCIIDFHPQIIDIFNEQVKNEKKVEIKICDEYFRIKNYLDKRPNRLEFYTYMDDDIYEYIKKQNKLNPFNDYISFLNRLNELESDEKNLIGTLSHNFIKEIETINMSKSYKIPLLKAFFNNGKIRLKINQDDIYYFFKTFYAIGSNAMDLMKENNGLDYKTWGNKEYIKVAAIPIDELLVSCSDFFYKNNNELCLTEDLSDFISNKYFIEHFKDVIDLRISNYYRRRLEENLNKNKFTVKYAFRDEIVNINAMTIGELPGKNRFQIILCKKEKIPGERRAFLLDTKKSPSIYGLSDKGKEYFGKINKNNNELKYIAEIDDQLKIKVSRKLFQKLYDDDLFSIWKVDAPINYFNDNEYGYLIIFRVYEILTSIEEELLLKGRKGRNYFYGLKSATDVDIIRPVISDEEFNRMKINLINIVQEYK